MRKIESMKLYILSFILSKKSEKILVQTKSTIRIKNVIWLILNYCISTDSRKSKSHVYGHLSLF